MGRELLIAVATITILLIVFNGPYKNVQVNDCPVIDSVAIAKKALTQGFYKGQISALEGRYYVSKDHGCYIYHKDPWATDRQKFNLEYLKKCDE